MNCNNMNCRYYHRAGGIVKVAGKELYTDYGRCTKPYCVIQRRKSKGGNQHGIKH